MSETPKKPGGDQILIYHDKMVRFCSKVAVEIRLWLSFACDAQVGPCPSPRVGPFLISRSSPV